MTGTIRVAVPRASAQFKRAMAVERQGAEPSTADARAIRNGSPAPCALEEAALPHRPASLSAMSVVLILLAELHTASILLAGLRGAEARQVP
jgi:hypothetical protein